MGRTTIIAGLGNPGAQYANTPHSIGFEAVDAIASALGADWTSKRQYRCLWSRGVLAGRDVILVKPQTYMNLSGECIAPLVKYQNATAADLVVIQDDIDLALGRLRIRRGGSCGGHNGVRNVIERLGTDAFVRIKLGVGRARADVVRFVLGSFDPASRAVADRLVAASVKAAEAIVSNGVERAMNAFNATDCAAE
jgi:PTH1 family peptidyl-tRNA hydrolase